MPLVALLLCLPAFVQGRSEPACAGQTALEQSRVEAAPELALQVEQRGKLNWFAGSFEQLLSTAAESKRLVFLDFYSLTNTYSKKFEKVTYCEPAVVAELSHFLCFEIDTDSKDTKALRKRFDVQAAPALVFLAPDGSLRDQLGSYFGPASFVRELRRIQANSGTFSDLRARVAANAGDLDARWELAHKLKSIGARAGYDEQVAEIHARDRDGHTSASHRAHVDAFYDAALAQLELEPQKLELEPLYAFVAAEKDKVVLFEGWWSLWDLEGQLARLTREPEAARVHELRYFAAARALWPLVPPEKYGILGNNIAWSFYDSRACATRSDLEFALEVARKAVAAAPDVAAVVDTLACCLFAVDKRAEALLQVQRCIELEPENPAWRERLAEFEAAK